MAGEMELISSIEKMYNICQHLAEAGEVIRFVPTMGALHKGHESLIRRAVEDPIRGSNGSTSLSFSDGGILYNSSFAEKPVVIVSIFVNPKQFNVVNDYDKYPNRLEHDLELCRKLKVDYLFMPKRDQVYPEEKSVCSIKPPDEIGNVLEGKSRPGHFEGVLTVVCKLFNIIRPHVAYFGEKDYQQMILVKKMVRDLNMHVEICPVTTIRDEHLLPLSSRNCRLSDELRQQAAYLMNGMLHNGKKALEQRCTISSIHRERLHFIDSLLNSTILTLQTLSEAIYNQSFEDLRLKVDYLDLRCSEHFAAIYFDKNQQLFDCSSGCLNNRPHADDKILNSRLVTSILICDVRLLDNISVELNRSFSRCSAHCLN